MQKMNMNKDIYLEQIQKLSLDHLREFCQSIPRQYDYFRPNDNHGQTRYYWSTHEEADTFYEKQEYRALIPKNSAPDHRSDHNIGSVEANNGSTICHGCTG